MAEPKAPRMSTRLWSEEVALARARFEQADLNSLEKTYFEEPGYEFGGGIARFPSKRNPYE